MRKNLRVKSEGVREADVGVVKGTGEDMVEVLSI